MNKNLFRAIAMLTLTACCFFAYAENPYVGYWALTIPGGGPGWLGIDQEGEKLEAGIL